MVKISKNDCKKKVLYLRFTGNKKNWIKEIEKIVLKYGYTKIAEPFGGSGVLSVNLMERGVVEKATVNDKANFLNQLDYILTKSEECFWKVHKKIGGGKRLETFIARRQKTNDRNYKGLSSGGIGLSIECFCVFGSRDRQKLKKR